MASRSIGIVRPWPTTATTKTTEKRNNRKSPGCPVVVVVPRNERGEEKKKKTQPCACAIGHDDVVHSWREVEDWWRSCLRKCKARVGGKGTFHRVDNGDEQSPPPSVYVVVIAAAFSSVRSCKQNGTRVLSLIIFNIKSSTWGRREGAVNDKGTIQPQNQKLRIR